MSLTLTPVILYQTERIKSLLAYGRGGIHDPVLALQRDSGSARGGLGDLHPGDLCGKDA